MMAAQSKTTPIDANVMKQMIKEAGCFGEKMEELIGRFSKLTSNDPPRFGPKLGDKIEDYKVLVRIGSGNSDVFAAEWDDGGLFAVKCAPKYINLKREFEIAKHCWPYSNLLKCLLYGEKENYNYLIEELTGDDLHTFLINPKKDCNLKEICKTLYEALKAIQQFHVLKFLHQDVKLENFAINLKNPAYVKLIDYGHSASIGRDGMCTEGRIGTFQFSSQSWLYCIIYAAKETLLEPWCYSVGGDEVKDKILDQKKAVWNNPVERLEFLSGLPIQFSHIMDIIEATTPEKPTEYSGIYTLLQQVITGENYTLMKAQELYFYDAIPLEAEEYHYYMTRNNTIAIIKGNIRYFRTDKCVKYCNGILRNFLCK
uniref:Protein kinase domain-containing protein n=1 Tax=Panagrolaimus sp. ES5 TaxID=591445 RepID=A0AC34F903_9BILA